MKKLVTLLLALTMIGCTSAFAEEQPTNVDRAAGIGIGAAWATGVSLAGGPTIGVMADSTPAALLAFGLVMGPIREFITSPERLGTGYQYNGQPEASDGRENKKWEYRNGLWASLVAYPEVGPGAVKINNEPWKLTSGVPNTFFPTEE